jgi:hypothetical protein
MCVHDDNRFEFGSSEQLRGQSFWRWRKDNLSGAVVPGMVSGIIALSPVLREYTSIEAL